MLTNIGKTKTVIQSGVRLLVSCIHNSPKPWFNPVKLKIISPEPGQNCGMGDCISPTHKKNPPFPSTFWKDKGVVTDFLFKEAIKQSFECGVIFINTYGTDKSNTGIACAVLASHIKRKMKLSLKKSYKK